MGYGTPNIDRIAKEGMMFTDSYGEHSSTAGRSIAPSDTRSAR
jgi:arylsulfatase